MPVNCSKNNCLLNMIQTLLVYVELRLSAAQHFSVAEFILKGAPQHVEILKYKIKPERITSHTKSLAHLGRQDFSIGRTKRVGKEGKLSQGSAAETISCDSTRIQLGRNCSG